MSTLSPYPHNYYQALCEIDWLSLFRIDMYTFQISPLLANTRMSKDSVNVVIIDTQERDQIPRHPLDCLYHVYLVAIGVENNMPSNPLFCSREGFEPSSCVRE